MTKGMFDWSEEEERKFYLENIESIAKRIIVIIDIDMIFMVLPPFCFYINILLSRTQERILKMRKVVL